MIGGVEYDAGFGDEALELEEDFGGEDGCDGVGRFGGLVHEH